MQNFVDRDHVRSA